MITWPPELVRAIARRKAVVVIGAGVSKNSENTDGKRPATWEEFLLSCLGKVRNKSLISRLITNKDYLTACQIIKHQMSADEFSNLIENEYQRSGYIPAKIHEHIYNLDASIVMSPNFDNIYETYANQVSRGTITVRDHTKTDIANYIHGGEYRLIIKSHGSADNPRNIIFTRHDYAEARTKYVLFYEIVKSLALTHTFLFIGCGIDDPDIRMLFEDIKFAHGIYPYHYMTIPDQEIDDDILSIVSATMRVKFLKYRDVNNHKELTDSLEELVSILESDRKELSSTMKW